ncbi:MAG TPA: hypothetical protein VFM54_00550 [Micromonosporaceae bacterium]|nr:hypothetical protein [Micromonosporaceae bacterium]
MSLTPPAAAAGRPRWQVLVSVAVAVVLLAVIGAVAGWWLGGRVDQDDGRGSGTGTGTGGFGSPTPSDPAAACGGFTDDFTGDGVAPQWERVRDGGFLVAGGAVEIAAADGADIYENELRAPMLLRVPKGNFIVETEVTVQPGYFYQGAGLVLWNGSQSYVRLERGYGNVGAIVFEYKHGGQHIKVRPPDRTKPSAITTDATRVQLQLSKTATAVTARWRPYGETEWRDAGTVQVALPDYTKVGVAALNRAQGRPKPTPRTLTARFEYVRVTCPAT